METIVLKFGGTSVGSTDRISAVAKLIQQASKEAFPVVVVSAMAGETNRLIELAESFGSEPNKREFDALISTGEKVSASLVAIALNQLGLKAKSLTAAQIGMKTTAQFSKAKILEMDNEIIFKTIADGYIPVVTGFQGITATGDITTMGRGGSDTTAVAIAASIKSKRCDIYTDVDGIYTTDPRIVPDAKKLDAICIEEMLELSGQGAKVIQIRAVEFANKYKVLVRILSSFEPGSGTLILQEENGMEDAVIRGIASQTDQTKFTLHGVVDTPGIASGILSPVSDAGIEVDVIVQNVSVSNKTDFTFTVATTDRSEVETVLKEKMVGISYDELIIDEEIGKVSLVGVGMRSHAGIASTAFKALADAGINIQMISTSEIKITIVIAQTQLEKAVRILHKAFNLGD
ncbi:MAG: aspartate kinase [SAR86 cluster bacterium BACL1 MAG-121105-bin34]|jgi:aspartate kinase|uniref:Aspartokinase n=1 Tax=SAR86 cluster bacterium BACL1 MAG-120820-bin45 TaxID=1655612 RepID=A0A0R2U9E0_9GAMM|nr:MAG: aspartate kinase [SAR86 cluster bacterium BACL1 MAG-120507-bin14]KRO96103.1 MAG: aspartate kinase [SAR86 cluster bacterium BACL1 MAG-120820-bin45]KRO97559.1 MAG: aspartate kinase [SAR86 cluster bacterium BACL1 MAG-120828-bin5]KRO99497.1 MAG: aspartate kinase [SAR86 cluster bacterium BACL1 MAG-120823-bin87]KRP00493.1 MAG: aspartate kinase [SAR86 cluster bacterium BACL1 MAG-120813-bin36]KRP03049.1 MAG: aspartate kinase [SAR86 cluster bacterium BACL1 MAG-120924-bin88]KRP03623.1 MAG: aspa